MADETSRSAWHIVSAAGSLEGAIPRVSVLLPVRDGATTLPAALASLRRQSERRWECVLVDDGSTDGTLEVAQRFASRDGRIRVLVRPRRGIVSALGDGIAACRADLVARMDADDVMRRDRLSFQRVALERSSSLTAVGSHVRLHPRAMLTRGMLAYERWLNGMRDASDVRRDAFIECPVAHPTLCIRRTILQSFGYRDLGWPEDYDLVLRLLAAGHEIGVVPRRLLLWRDLPERSSRTDPRYALDRFTACKAAALAAGFLAGSSGYVLWGYGDTGRALHAALARHGHRPSHIVEVHPGRLGNLIHGARVVHPDGLGELAGRPLVASVAGASARARIRAALSAVGRCEGRDFVVAA